MIKPHLLQAKYTARPDASAMRNIVNGIFHAIRSGCALRQLQKDYPPWGTVYRWGTARRDSADVAIRTMIYAAGVNAHRLGQCHHEASSSNQHKQVRG